MGYSLSWLAVKYGTQAAVLERLGLEATDEEFVLDDGTIVGLALPGWYLVLQNREMDLVDADVLGRASDQCTVLAGCIEEHVMWSTLEEWIGGQQQWAVQHDGNRKANDLTTEGKLPSAYASIAERAKAAQKQADARKEGVDHLWDVPHDLGVALLGFDTKALDEVEDAVVLQGTLLTRAAGERARSKAARDGGERKGFFSRLFGRSRGEAKPAPTPDETRLLVNGDVTDKASGRKVAGVRVTAHWDSGMKLIMTTEADGYYAVELPFDQCYELVFERDNYVSKRLQIDTRAVPMHERPDALPLQVDMELFKVIQGLDLPILQQPIGKARYDVSRRKIWWDMQHTRSVQQELERLISAFKK